MAPRRFAMVSTAIAIIAVLLGCNQVLGWKLQIPLIDSRFRLQSNANQHPQGELHQDNFRPWSIFEHLGGNSPWIQKTRGVLDEGLEPPSACYVDQVHMISRHAERFPTTNSGIQMLELLRRMRDANVTYTGDLAFLKDWEFFSSNPAGHFDSLVSMGPYAGTLDAFTTGVKLRTRYGRLLDQALERRAATFWASDSERVIDTGRYFAAGFFGIDWERIAKLVVVPESTDRGADTLTPGDTCLEYRADEELGHDYGYRMREAWRSVYESGVLSRLTKENPNLPLVASDIFTMQTICGFEIIARGSSPWCEIFKHDEWESYAYARDLLHYYRAGPGNAYSAAMGWLWLNATANLLEAGPEAGPLFFSFVHDGDIVPFLHALNLFPQTPDLPSSAIPKHRNWSTSDIVPMGGRIILERLACRVREECWSNPLYPNHIYCEPEREDYFIRINVNDGIVPLPDCQYGPGHSCPLRDFLAHVQKRGEEAGEFGEVCGLSKDASKRITFLHQ